MKTLRISTKVRMRAVLLIGFLLTCTAPIAIFWYSTNRSVLKYELDAATDRHLLIARNLGGILAHYHDDLVSTFEALAPKVAAGEKVELARPLLGKLHVRHVCVFAVGDGKLARDFTGNRPGCPKSLPAGRLDELLKLADARHGRAVISGVRAATKGEPSISIALRSGDKLAVASVATTFFTTLARRISFGEKGHATIVDKAGRILAHPLPDWEAAMVDLSKLAPIRKALTGLSGVTQFDAPALGGRAVAGYVPVARAGWAVMVPQPLSELEAIAVQISFEPFKMLVVGLLFAAGLAILFSSFISRPLAIVTGLARRMARGETTARLDARLTSHPIQEFAELGRAYNEMSDEIERSHDKDVALRVKAEAAGDAKNQFLAVMSHEIRTPLNGLLGIAALLNTTKLDDKQRRFVDQLVDSGHSLMRVLNDVLDYSQIEAGHLEIAPEPCRLGNVARSVADLMSLEARRNEIALSIETEAGIDDNLVSDAHRIRQVLLNLVGNAIKFTRKGSVTIRIGHIEDNARGSFRIAVTDTGIGIPEEARDRIFSDFMQVDSSMRRSHGGSGLGLAISRRLVEAMGGEIGFTSQVGAGSEFWFTLIDMADSPTDGIDAAAAASA